MSLKRFTSSILLALMLFWIYTGSATYISGDNTNTLSGGGATDTLSGGGGTQTLSGGNSGGGGGGGASGESYANIEVKEKYDLYIFKDKVTIYTFSNTSNPVLFVNITGNVNAGEINVAVEVLRNTSSLLNDSAPGMVYKNINIWVGTSGFAVPRNIKEATIRFKVESSWLDSNDFTASDVRMFRWDGNQWLQLETRTMEKDSTYTYYEAMADSFSSFAVAGLKNMEDEKAGFVTATKIAGPIETTNVPAITPVERSPGFEAMLVLVAICGIYLSARNRR